MAKDLSADGLGPVLGALPRHAASGWAQYRRIRLVMPDAVGHTVRAARARCGDGLTIDGPPEIGRTNPALFAAAAELLLVWLLLGITRPVLVSATASGPDHEWSRAKDFITSARDSPTAPKLSRRHAPRSSSASSSTTPATRTPV